MAATKVQSTQQNENCSVDLFRTKNYRHFIGSGKFKKQRKKEAIVWHLKKRQRARAALHSDMRTGSNCQT